MSFDIGIVGAGFAGAAAALFLARDGHRVTIYEEAPVPRAIGAGILLQPSGLAVLAELGLLEEVVARGAIVRGVRIRTRAGRNVMDLAYADLEPAWFGLGLHRGALFECLFRAVGKTGVTVHCGRSVRNLLPSGTRQTVHDADDRALGEHDLVVVADGARSELRHRFRGLRRARPYPWGALWFVARDPENRFADRLSQVSDGTRRLLGFLPSGLGPEPAAAAPRDETTVPTRCPLVSLFWSVRLDGVEAWRRAGLEPWKREILDLDPRAEAVLSQIESPEQVLTASYVDVRMRRFHEPGVVFVGDAAHATSPQLGQGTNLALEDARVLARCLRQHAIEPALAAYSSARRRHVAYYQWASRALTPFFQSDGVVLGWLRDAFMGTVSGLPGIEGFMLRTLAGVQRGVFRSPLVLGASPTPKVLPTGATSP